MEVPTEVGTTPLEQEGSITSSEGEVVIDQGNLLGLPNLNVSPRPKTSFRCKDTTGGEKH
jgi:hypothetical protein